MQITLPTLILALAPVHTHSCRLVWGLTGVPRRLSDAPSRARRERVGRQGRRLASWATRTTTTTTATAKAKLNGPAVHSSSQHTNYSPYSVQRIFKTFEIA